MVKPSGGVVVEKDKLLIKSSLQDSLKDAEIIAEENRKLEEMFNVIVTSRKLVVLVNNAGH